MIIIKKKLNFNKYNIFFTKYTIFIIVIIYINNNHDLSNQLTKLKICYIQHKTNTSEIVLVFGIRYEKIDKKDKKLINHRSPNIESNCKYS